MDDRHDGGGKSDTAESARETQARRVLRVLSDRDGTMSVGDLADAVHRDVEDDRDFGDVHEDLFENVLPALDQSGDVTFDRERGIVSESRPDRR